MQLIPTLVATRIQFNSHLVIKNMFKITYNGKHDI